MSENTTHQSLKASATTVITSVPVSDAIVLSVEQLNIQIKQLLEGQLGQVWVQGEISNFKPHTSGHFYFSLKDSKSQISAVMFRGHNLKLKFKPTDGLEVIVRGRLAVYEPRGSYQIICESMEPVGAGALQKAYEQLKDKLKSEGLFESSRKKPIPHFPRHVAIITSPTGAAIRDILNILKRRAPSLPVTIIPSLVQGEGAAENLCESFLKVKSLQNVDVIIIGRGGGSIEDLWAFNNESLARLIAVSEIPVISAVGHEIDFTICDFVADLRAPTPSAAAELVAKSNQETIQRLTALKRLLMVSLEKTLKNKKNAFQILNHRLVDPQKKLQDLSLRNDDLMNRLDMAMSRFLERQKHKVHIMEKHLIRPTELIRFKKGQIDILSHQISSQMNKIIQKKTMNWKEAVTKLNAFNPLQIVERGYSLVEKDGELVRDAQQVKLNDELKIKLAVGEIKAKVTEVRND